MEENAGPSVARRSTSNGSLTFRFCWLTVVLGLLGLTLASCGPARRGEVLARVASNGRLVYGSDREGGGPYIFPDPNAPREVTGFEVELMRALAVEVQAQPVFSQGQWDRLLQELDAGMVDLVINGYEWTETRARNYAASRPYYIYQLQLMAPRAGPLRGWSDVKTPRSGNGRKWKIGVLVQSAADTFAVEQGGSSVEVVRFDGATDAMTAAANGQIDATLQDLPAALFYRERFPSLLLAGEPVGKGYYVIYTRHGDEPLRDAINRGLDRMIATGELRALYERYGIWNAAQNGLASLDWQRLHIKGGKPRPGVVGSSRAMGRSCSTPRS